MFLLKICIVIRSNFEVISLDLKHYFPYIEGEVSYDSESKQNM